MRRFAFIVALLGIVILLVFMGFPGMEIEVDGAGDLERLEINEKVFFSGSVESVRDFGDFKILIFNGVEVVCDCPSDFFGVGVEVEVIGKVEEFNGKRQIKALKIKIV
jgi:hypothetical protein